MVSIGIDRPLPAHSLCSLGLAAELDDFIDPCAEVPVNHCPGLHVSQTGQRTYGLLPYLNWPPEPRLSWVNVALPQSLKFDTVVSASRTNVVSALPAAASRDEMVSLWLSRSYRRPGTEYVSW
jgi:hypothetical protein